MTDAALGARMPIVLLLGNPNVGKTLLFNRLTGQRARIGNCPGITVEHWSGAVCCGYQVVDASDPDADRAQYGERAGRPVAGSAVG